MAKIDLPPHYSVRRKCPAHKPSSVITEALSRDGLWRIYIHPQDLGSMQSRAAFTPYLYATGREDQPIGILPPAEVWINKAVPPGQICVAGTEAITHG